MELRALILRLASSPGRWTRALAVRCPLCPAGVGERCYKMACHRGVWQECPGGGQQRRPHTARLAREERRGFELRCPGCQALQVTGSHRPRCPVAERMALV